MERERGDSAEVGDTHKDLVAVEATACCDGCFGGSDPDVCRSLPDCYGIIWIKQAVPNADPPVQTDPNGLDPHAPGAKLDTGKIRPGLVLGGFARALKGVSEVGTFGAAKYTDNGWQEVPNGQARYEDAQLRHWLDSKCGVAHDKESHLLHLKHEAWNAQARLDLYLREQEKVTT